MGKKNEGYNMLREEVSELLINFSLLTILLRFFSKALILQDLLLEVTFKDFKAIRNFCKSVVIFFVTKFLCHLSQMSDYYN